MTFISISVTPSETVLLLLRFLESFCGTRSRFFPERKPSMIFQELNDLAEHPEAQRRERVPREKEDDGCGGGAERSRCTSIIV